MKLSLTSPVLFTVLSLGYILPAQAAPNVVERQLPVLAPTVVGASPKATYIGASSLGVESWNGIPFAVPPVGKNRLYAPSTISTALGTVTATGTPSSCPQQGDSIPVETDLPASVQKLLSEIPLFQELENQSEDCLTLNIQRPAGTTSSSKLPVLFYIYGGGFEAGSTSTYNGANLISTSVSANQPIMFVAVNYRLSAFGFLPGQEVYEAGTGNLGLLDQRLGLKWVADNIAKFGGDPTKVTIWGESAGSISVADQMFLYNGDNTYKGKPLFRGAMMDSGSIVPANPINGTKGQAVYDAVVAAAGCDGYANTLQCLRNVPYSKFLKASNSLPGIFSYDSVALAYLPRPDGKSLTQSPELLAEAGLFAKVPFIVGDQEDEGTLFSLVQSNLTTTADVVNYLYNVFFPDVPRSRVAGLVATYPDKAPPGSPFHTGSLNEIYPQFKRIAAILGDLTFILTRRIFLSIVQKSAPSVPSWSYLSSYFYGTPVLGTFHGSDILIAFETVPSEAGAAIASYYISFVNYLNPNQGAKSSLPNWPEWGANNELLHFQTATNTLLKDDFRNASYAYVSNPANVLRI